MPSHRIARLHIEKLRAIDELDVEAALRLKQAIDQATEDKAQRNADRVVAAAQRAAEKRAQAQRNAVAALVEDERRSISAHTARYAAMFDNDKHAHIAALVNLERVRNRVILSELNREIPVQTDILGDVRQLAREFRFDDAFVALERSRQAGTVDATERVAAVEQHFTDQRDALNAAYGATRERYEGAYDRDVEELRQFIATKREQLWEGFVDDLRRIREEAEVNIRAESLSAAAQDRSVAALVAIIQEIQSAVANEGDPEPRLSLAERMRVWTLSPTRTYSGRAVEEVPVGYLRSRHTARARLTQRCGSSLHLLSKLDPLSSTSGGASRTSRGCRYSSSIRSVGTG